MPEIVFSLLWSLNSESARLFDKKQEDIFTNSLCTVLQDVFMMALKHSMLADEPTGWLLISCSRSLKSCELWCTVFAVLVFPSYERLHSLTKWLLKVELFCRICEDIRCMMDLQIYYLLSSVTILIVQYLLCMHVPSFGFLHTASFFLHFWANWIVTVGTE